MLLDLGRYIASESTFYRVMREHKQLKHRRSSSATRRKKPQALQAKAPNQVYSWDITYLPTPVKGMYFYLYMVMDIFSRKIVGWQVHDTESSSYAADLIEDIARREHIDKQQLVIHSDNGSPMRGATLRARLEILGIVPSYSRPRTSNDNPYSEALFKTVKYHYSYPDKPFETLHDARQWVMGFVDGYNKAHQHSALKFVTPEQRHAQQDEEILAQRKAVLEQAKAQNPERWNGRKIRNLERLQVVYLNPQ
jgi:transposase InsO family protein